MGVQWTKHVDDEVQVMFVKAGYVLSGYVPRVKDADKERLFMKEGEL